MSWVYVIIIGFVIGLIARFLMPGRDVQGFILTTVVGIGGSLLATYAGEALHIYTRGQPAGFIASVIGAIVLLAILRMVRR